LFAGEIHADYQGRFGRKRQARICRHASLSTHQPMGTINPVSSATGMNSTGNKPTLWMLPAEQGLKTANPTAGERYNRLVVKAEFLSFERPPQVSL